MSSTPRGAAITKRPCPRQPERPPPPVQRRERRPLSQLGTLPLEIRGNQAKVRSAKVVCTNNVFADSFKKISNREPGVAAFV